MPKITFWAHFPIFRLIFPILWEAKPNIFPFFSISGQRPANPVLAGGQGRKSGLVFFFYFVLRDKVVFTFAMSFPGTSVHGPSRN